MDREAIRSLQNPRVKELVRLRSKAPARRESGCTLADGVRDIGRALELGVELVELWHDEAIDRHDGLPELLRRARAAGTTLQPASAAVLARVGYGQREPGCCAVLRWAPTPLEEAPPPAPNAFWLVVEGLEKPGNLGALARSADGAGVDAILLVDPRLEPANPNAIRASTGALFARPIHVATAALARPWLAGHGFRLLSLAPQATRPYWEAPAEGQVALVAGSEDRGLTPTWRGEGVEELVIPTAGRVDSLNLSVSVGIALFDLARRR